MVSNPPLRHEYAVGYHAIERGSENFANAFVHLGQTLWVALKVERISIWTIVLSREHLNAEQQANEDETKVGHIVIVGVRLIFFM